MVRELAPYLLTPLAFQLAGFLLGAMLPRRDAPRGVDWTGCSALGAILHVGCTFLSLLFPPSLNAVVQFICYTLPLSILGSALLISLVKPGAEVPARVQKQSVLSGSGSAFAAQLQEKFMAMQQAERGSQLSNYVAGGGFAGALLAFILYRFLDTPLVVPEVLSVAAIVIGALLGTSVAAQLSDPSKAGSFAGLLTACSLPGAEHHELSWIEEAPNQKEHLLAPAELEDDPRSSMLELRPRDQVFSYTQNFARYRVSDSGGELLAELNWKREGVLQERRGAKDTRLTMDLHQDQLTVDLPDVRATQPPVGFDLEATDTGVRLRSQSRGWSCDDRIAALALSSKTSDGQVPAALVESCLSWAIQQRQRLPSRAFAGRRQEG